MSEQQGLDIRPDVATWNWLRRLAAEAYGGNVRICIESVLRDARIAAERVSHGSVDPSELPADPWAPLDEQLHQHRTDTTTNP